MQRATATQDPNPKPIIPPSGPVQSPRPTPHLPSGPSAVEARAELAELEEKLRVAKTNASDAYATAERVRTAPVLAAARDALELATFVEADLEKAKVRLAPVFIAEARAKQIEERESLLLQLGTGEIAASEDYIVDAVLRARASLVDAVRRALESVARTNEVRSRIAEISKSLGIPNDNGLASIGNVVERVNQRLLLPNQPYEDESAHIAVIDTNGKVIMLKVSLTDVVRGTR